VVFAFVKKRKNFFFFLYVAASEFLDQSNRVAWSWKKKEENFFTHMTLHESGPATCSQVILRLGAQGHLRKNYGG